MALPRGPDRLSEVCTIFQHQNKNLLKRLFGPGTIVSLVAALGIVAYSSATAKPTAPRVSQLPQPTRPLVKPEPGDLLRRQDLRPAQRQAIERVDRAWRKDKEALMAAMERYQPQQGRADQIQAGLRDYSALSRRYDVTRSEAWESALAALDPAQRAEALR